MKTSPNEYRSPLRSLPPPKAWRSKQAKRLVEAVLRGTRNTDFSVVEKLPDLDPPTFTSPRAVNPALAANFALEYLDRLDAWSSKARAAVTMYNDSRRRPVALSCLGLARDARDQEEWMLTVMRSDRHRIVRAGNTAFEIDATGAYREVAE